MKTKNTLVKRGALIAVLILGSGAWISAQDTPGLTPGKLPAQTPGQPGGYENRVGRAQDVRTTETTRSYTNTAGIQTNSQTLATKKVNKGSVIIGTTVKNQQGEELGEIRDLVIDFQSDRVAYVVVASDIGVFNAEKLHAVPLRAFQPNADGSSLTLNADKNKFEHSAGFDKDSWPAMGNSAWGAEPLWKDYQSTNSTQSGRDSGLQRDYRNNKDAINEPSRNDALNPLRR